MRNYLIIFGCCMFMLSCRKEVMEPAKPASANSSTPIHKRAVSTFVMLDVPAAWGSGTSAYGNNNSGVIVGNFANTTGGAEGFVYSNGQFTDVVVPGADPSDRGNLFDVNNSGTSVGAFTSPDLVHPHHPNPISHSFTRSSAGIITVLPDPAAGALSAEANGINDNGIIVGNYTDAASHRHGFIFTNGSYTTYDFPGAIRTFLNGVNNSGHVIGYYRDVFNIVRGVILYNNTTTTIVFPGSSRTKLFGINNAGIIVGEYLDGSGVTHGFVYEQGIYQTVDFPGSTDTALLGISDNIVIVGTYNGYSRGFKVTLQ